MTKLNNLKESLVSVLGDVVTFFEEHSEITIEVNAAHYYDVCQKLQSVDALSFKICIDLCGVDYLTYKEQESVSRRYAIVLHLLSVEHNWRLRVRVFADDNEFPTIPSLISVWPTVNWYEREAFDLYGIMFEGHPDLRRILTDYGFIGHPFRKDFPLSGHVEMRYDIESKRVVYQPVTIEPREITPRVIREQDYGAGR